MARMRHTLRALRERLAGKRDDGDRAEKAQRRAAAKAQRLEHKRSTDGGSGG
jgi:hypothetical protein